MCRCTTRTLDQADVITPFGTLPSNIDWGQVPGDLLVQLGAGIQQAIDDGLVSDTPVINPLETIAHLIGLGNGGSTLTTTLNATAETVTADQAPKTQKSLAPNDTDVPATAATQDRDDLDEAAKKAARRTEAAANRAAERTEAALKKAGGRVDKIAKDGQKEIQKVVKAVQGGVQNAVGADKKTETAADKAADKTTDKAGELPAGILVASALSSSATHRPRPASSRAKLLVCNGFRLRPAARGVPT